MEGTKGDADVLGEDGSPRGLDRFGLLLLMSVITIVVQSLIDVGQGFADVGATIGALAVTFSMSATIVLAYRAAGAPKRIQRAAVVFASVATAVIIVALALQATGGDASAADTSGGAPITWLALSAIAPVVVVRRLLQHRTIGIQTLYGALAGYLLIGVSFNFAYQTIGALQHTPFFGVEVPTTSYMYFSLVTLTTVGYGSLEAVTPLGQLASMLGAIVGQTYLVTVVAMIVGLLAQRRP